MKAIKEYISKEKFHDLANVAAKHTLPSGVRLYFRQVPFSYFFYIKDIKKEKHSKSELQLIYNSFHKYLMKSIIDYIQGVQYDKKSDIKY